MSRQLYLQNSKNIVATNCNSNISRLYYIQVNLKNALAQLHSTKIMQDFIDTKLTDPHLHYKYRFRVIQEQNARKQ